MSKRYNTFKHHTSLQINLESGEKFIFFQFADCCHVQCHYEYSRIKENPDYDIEIIKKHFSNHIHYIEKALYEFMIKEGFI